jgi:WXG100 family type VII secretion target
MAIVGMDVEQVTNVGHQLQGQSDAISQVITHVEGLISQAESVWKGGDADGFRDTWHGHYKPAMLQVQQALHGLGQSAINNATEQRNVSSH